MPFMDGYDTTESIREFLFENGIQQPIIVAVSGHAEQSYVDRAINAGMNQVLSKPVNNQVIINLTQLLDY